MPFSGVSPGLSVVGESVDGVSPDVVSGDSLTSVPASGPASVASGVPVSVVGGKFPSSGFASPASGFIFCSMPVLASSKAF